MVATESWTIKKLLDWSETYFESHAISEGKLNGQWLLSHVLQCKRMDLFLQFDRELTDKELQSYKALIVRRTKHEPLQYIMGEADFIGKLFSVSPAVLIPRLDTEVLAEQAMLWLKTNKVDAVLDIGTGAGILAITLSLTFPDVPILATDISADALAVAKLNAERHGVNISFEKTSWPSQIPGVGTILVVTNPPYIVEDVIKLLDAEVKDHEPVLALCGGADGLVVIRQIVKDIASSQRPVQLLMEIGYDQGPAMVSLLSQSNFINVHLIPDYEGRDRVIAGYFKVS